MKKNSMYCGMVSPFRCRLEAFQQEAVLAAVLAVGILGIFTACAVPVSGSFHTGESRDGKNFRQKRGVV